MAKPLWHSNFLACYPAILQRLEQVDGVKKVLEAQDLASISTGRKQVPLDGVVYVVFDGFSPKNHNNAKREQMLDIGFSVILTKSNISPRPQTDGIGETLTAIMQALQGFQPQDEHGNDLTLSPLMQTQALAIRYEDGFAYFPMRFSTEIAILGD